MDDEKYEGGYDLAYRYMHGRVAYAMRLTATSETDTSTTYEVDLVEQDEDGKVVRVVGERIIEVPIKPLYSAAQLADMHSKGIDTSFATNTPRPGHHDLFDYNEGYYYFREWMRDRGEPEKIALAERRTVSYLDDVIHEGASEASRVISNLLHRWRVAPGDNPDFTSITAALIAYERAGDALLEEALRWNRSDDG